MASCDEKQFEFCGRRFETLERKLDRVLDLLDGREGLIVDVDRLKESRRKQGKVLWVLIGCAVTAFGDFLFSFFRPN